MDYIKIKGQKIELTEEQAKEFAERFGLGKAELSSIPVGEVFKIGDYEFVVLEHSGDTTAVILKNILKTSIFGGTNDFRGSDAEDICQAFGSKISSLVGANNLVEHTVDLTSDDGLKDYGKIRSFMSLLTAERYRKYVEILDKHKIDDWWWLATAYSTSKHDNDVWVKCVSPSGCIIIISICNYYHGVRPFCILKSNIFVSK